MEHQLNQNQALVKKWAPILDAEGQSTIKDAYKRSVVAQLLENTEREVSKETMLNETHANNGGTSIALGGAGAMTGQVAGYDPILINMVRRSAPMLVAYDVCGVQPMTMPTSLIFGLKARYGHQGGKEALYNEADMSWSGTDAKPAVAGVPATSTFVTDSEDPFGDALNLNHGMDTATAENTAMNQMAFTIERGSVTAKTRALKAEMTMELAQDLKAVHSLDGDAELTNILTTEIMADINREILHTIYKAATLGCQSGTQTAGVFDLDTDSNGRWSVEKFKGLLFRIEQEANAIGHLTRRGRGNFIICSADVASAMSMAGVLDVAGKQSALGGLNVDDTSTTFAGILNGRYKVFIDPYAANQAGNQFVVVGYKGTSPFDAGIIYSPYVPLQQMRAIDPVTFQPKVAYKTRYGISASGMSNGDGTFNTAVVDRKNVYYRAFLCRNIG